jgi:aryl-alcohol dehydrogenase-like predicted oxidoreductase/histidinol phosphatase-like enzyme/predicted kinase
MVADRLASAMRPIGIGCMRLSTAPDRDDERAIAVLHAALDAGATFLDTADAYCLDQSNSGHNERLIARALDAWAGDRSRVIVATKGGLTRPGGQWVPDGRATHLAAACEASRRALGVERIALYQLHAPDPRTSLATSVRALAALKEAGAIERIGLCNVSRGQIEMAQQIAPIDAVQVELSVFRDREILSGVVRYCIDHDIQLIAHRPLGGVRKKRALERDPVLVDLARQHDVTPQDIALAWLLDLAGGIVPIPGPTRVETATRIGRASQVRLTDEDRARLDLRVPAAVRLRPTAAAASPAAALSRAAGELVLIMGLPAAGKSTLAQSFVQRGYTRLNRDEMGGSLAALASRLEGIVASGNTQLVADNTFVTRQARAPMLDAAARLGLRVRGLWLATGLEDAQTNAVSRMISRYGRLLEPAEIRQTSKRDPNVFAPGVLFRYQRELEPPDASEGFAEIDQLPFVRQADPAWSNRAVIVRADGVLRRSRAGHRTPRSADDLDVPADAAAAVRRVSEDGCPIIALGWRPEIADGTMTAGAAAEIDARLAETIGVSIEVLDCTHPAGPPICWCRKPLPGLGVLCVHRHRLDPGRCLYVGDGPQDSGFARRCGFPYAPQLSIAFP